jgi:hypothetical protein
VDLIVSPAKTKGRSKARSTAKAETGGDGKAPAAAAQDMPQSAAMPSPFPPIAEYAFLSNCHTGALVAPDGGIDWLCVPRFDSPSILMDRLLSIASPLGLYAEEFDPSTGRHLGNFPQAFSHLALIEAAARIILSKRLKEIGVNA